VKRSSRYDERDYAFGQAMLTLRTNIGLTQAGLADLLHVSRRAVAEWEAGSNYPKAEHLKQFIASYAGNPLALKIVAQTIADMFSGDIAQFLREGELIFNGIRAVLRQQMNRLTHLEQGLI
jgi:transcriptional regulator with XRE-family HTH domain